LFEERLPFAAFDSKMRTTILDCCALDWSKISPAIFGSMFQAAMNPKERRNLGAHYTSEKNILKLIKPLFLDELYEEFEKAKVSQPKLLEFQSKLSKLKLLDPACGSGNFLIIAYRELRLLEIEILKELFFVKQKMRKEVMADAAVNLNLFVKVNVDQFYGIEYDEFPARIAEVAMWLIDHQMNMLVSEEFGQYFVRLPLKKAATIVNDNALRIEWESIVPKEELNFILGNPPFYGSKNQTPEQKEDIEVAFVSTNSITQGEQVGLIWNELFNLYKMKIDFAHRTFQWTNQAKGNAAVHVVIIGFSKKGKPKRIIYDYESLKGEPQEIEVKNINPYLIEGKDIFVAKRRKPICKVPEMINGSKVVDGGNLLFTDEEKLEFIAREPNSEKYFRKFIGSVEFINNRNRWCLWLKEVKPTELKNMPNVLLRLEKVKEMRISSKKEATKKWANFPTLFIEDRQPDCDYLIIPRVSSVNREYIPIGYLSKDVIVSDRATTLPFDDKFIFGSLISKMHMVWMKTTCGRLKSDFNYSNTIVYNNYPFPKEPNIKNKENVEKAAQKVLDTRANYPDSSLADLYDPLTMPPDLVKAHQQLDKAVDLCYRPQPFTNERNRIEFLFELYEQYTLPLLKES